MEVATYYISYISNKLSGYVKVLPLVSSRNPPQVLMIPQSTRHSLSHLPSLIIGSLFDCISTKPPWGGQPLLCLPQTLMAYSELEINSPPHLV